MLVSDNNPWKRFEKSFDAHYEILLITLVVLCLVLMMVGAGFLMWSRLVF